MHYLYFQAGVLLSIIEMADYYTVTIGNVRSWLNPEEIMKVLESFSSIRRVRRLAAHVWRHFGEDRLFDEAASLSYTSLLSMVPLLAVGFGVASVFPVFQQWSEQLKTFIFTNFVPALRRSDTDVPYRFSGKRGKAYPDGYSGFDYHCAYCWWSESNGRLT